MNLKHEEVLKRIEETVAGTTSREECLRDVSQLLAENFRQFDWVGFYLVDQTKERELVLGPYVGAPTEHTRIAFGTGICGQAADTQATFVVKDVEQETNYLSCSPNVKSEIVVPIFRGDKIVAELDIDSHKLNAFSEEDRVFLERVCEVLAALFESTPHQD
jgi:GAF domain-containing protein